MFDDDLKDVPSGDAQTEDTSPSTEKKPKSEPSWEERFNGMKGTAVKYQKQVERLSAQLTSLQQQLEETNLSLTGERDKYKSEAEKLSSEATQIKDEFGKLKKQTEVSRMIRRDFGQELHDLFEEGLLLGVDSLEGDALKDYLTRYSQKLGAVKKAGLEEITSGAKPPAPSQQAGQAGVTLQSAQADLQRAMATHGSRSPEYQKAMENYLAVIQKGTS